MVKDARLELGRYVTNPFNRRGDVTKRLDFDDLFTSKAAAEMLVNSYIHSLICHSPSAD